MPSLVVEPVKGLQRNAFPFPPCRGTGAKAHSPHLVLRPQSGLTHSLSGAPGRMPVARKERSLDSRNAGSGTTGLWTSYTPGKGWGRGSAGGGGGREWAGEWGATRMERSLVSRNAGSGTDGLWMSYLMGGGVRGGGEVWARGGGREEVGEN